MDPVLTVVSKPPSWQVRGYSEGARPGAASFHRSPGLVFWNDGCMSAKLYDSAARSEDFPAGLQVERIQGVGHFLHQEQPGILNELLVSWLKQHNSK